MLRGHTITVGQEHGVLRTGLLVGGAAVTVIAFAYWLHQRPVGRGASLTPPALATHPGISRNTGGENKNAGSAIAARPARKPVLSILRDRLNNHDSDWYALAQEILPQAKAGNAEAQYVLFKTITGCDGGGRWGASADSLEAARAAARLRYPDVPQVERAFEMGYGRCHGFKAAEAKSLGDPWDWLTKAMDAGYGPALAAGGNARLLQDEAKAAVRAGSTPNEPTLNLPPIGGDATARELFAVAAQSADPEVLQQISTSINMLRPDLPEDELIRLRVAWAYVACQRGLDCTPPNPADAIHPDPYGPPTVVNCGPNDGPCTPVPGFLLALANYNWAPVQEVVNQINAALNAKQWDRLPGLAPGG